MPRKVAPLTDSAIKAAKPQAQAYKLADGSGLYLEVMPAGSKIWRMKYQIKGKERRITFGAYPAVTLQQARQEREQARDLVSQGIDPVAERKAAKQEEEATGLTFERVAVEWHTARSTRWSKDHASRVLNRMETHLFPSLGSKPIDALKLKDLLAPIKEVEARGTLETASRLSQYTAGVMRHAIQHDYIETNPATDLTGAIATPKTKHRPALPLDRLGELQERIDAYPGRTLTRLAVMLTLHVFIRSSELRFARWHEIDFARAMWTIPPEREALPDVRHSTRGSKMGDSHLVPLSPQAMTLLESIHHLTGNGELVFPGDHDERKPMSENTVNKALRLMGYDTQADVCGHGFRTMACSALTESGLWSEDAVERQMSHKERKKVRAAYIHRAEHLEQRRLMLNWWSTYLESCREGYVPPFEYAMNHGAPGTNVVSIKRKV
ncbi:MAG: integrase arm-type DNA-binding domain-containing protein [Porticoccaceae bacterium]